MFNIHHISNIIRFTPNTAFVGNKLTLTIIKLIEFISKFMLTAYKVIALVATGLRHVAILKIKILFQNDQILLPKKVVFICSLSSKHTPLAYRLDIPITKLAH